jgi:hypothetical protein
MLSDSIRVLVIGSVTVAMKDSYGGRRYEANQKIIARGVVTDADGMMGCGFEP